MPLTSGFPAELLIIIGALTAHPTLGITALAGAITHSNVEQVQDLRPRELALLCVPALLVLLFGFMPNKVLKINQKAAEVWLNRLVEQPANVSTQL
jgi:NADH-quinone oxidoreductase subunit M